MVFSTAFFPPLEFFVRLVHSDKIYIEACEHFVKQTYRNRCVIYTANGTQNLVVGLVKCRRNHLPIKDVEISYDMPWNKIHWRAIIAAYNKSPFFMHYRDVFEKFFTQKFRWLFEYNQMILMECLLLLDLRIEVFETSVFQKTYSDDEDYRYTINPRIKSELVFPEYIQVFSDRHGFQPNLSIIDLLCNLGPDSKKYLQTII